MKSNSEEMISAGREPTTPLVVDVKTGKPGRMRTGVSRFRGWYNSSGGKRHCHRDRRSSAHTRGIPLDLPDSKQFELVEGQLVENNMGVKESIIAWTLNSQTGVSMPCPEPDKDSRPTWDTAASLFHQRSSDAPMVRLFVGRLSESMLDDGFSTIAPDLAIEVVSPHDLYREVEAKIDEYLRWRAIGVGDQSGPACGGRARIVWTAPVSEYCVMASFPARTCCLGSARRVAPCCLSCRLPGGLQEPPPADGRFFSLGC